MPYNSLLKGRHSATNQHYHIVICTYRRTPAFSDLQLGRLMVKHLAQLDKQDSVTTYAFCLMPDHLHWLFLLKQADLPQLINQLKGKTAHQFNQYLNRSGSFWQKGYYDHAIRHDEDLKQTARYIVANPLRAKLVDKIGDYPLWDAIWL